MKAACAKRTVVIQKKDLPLACPLPNEAVYSAHPRVYLPIEKNKRVICKYCSTEYILSEETVAD